MSRAFVNEDAPEPPPPIPERAPLPQGVVNHVTPRGMTLLLQEKEKLLQERADWENVEEGDERRYGLILTRGKLAKLEERIASARVIDLSTQPPEEIRFGATVQTRDSTGAVRRFRIVGVDEADPSVGDIAFTAPLSKALLGKEVGDTATLQIPAGEEEYEVLSIEYS